MGDKLRAGLAVYGSALDRWYLCDFLKDAGLPLNDAYRPRSRDVRVRLMAEGLEDVEVVSLRPEVAPEELWAEKEDSGSEGLDIAIMGSDIAMEGEKEGYHVKKLGALGMGNVDIVMAVQESLGVSNLGELLKKRREMNKPTICATEYYTHLAAETIAKDPVYQQLYPRTTPQIMWGKTIKSGNNPMVAIKYSQGKTEIMCISGFAQLMIDNVQSGDTLRVNDYKTLEKLGESWYRLYAGPHITKRNTEKCNKAILVRDLLREKAVGKKYTYVIFDFAEENEAALMKYMENEGLYTVKPFVLRGNGSGETKILVPRSKIAAVTEGLREHGAKAPTRIAVESTGLDLPDEEIDRLIERKVA
jgi:ATP phosphoribosyltransferase